MEEKTERKQCGGGGDGGGGNSREKERTARKQVRNERDTRDEDVRREE